MKFKIKFMLVRMHASLFMKSVSMVDFRLHPEKIIAQVQKGKRLVLTCRGKPVARLEPIHQGSVQADDSFYSLDALSDTTGESLINAQIDDILYGQ